VLGAAGHEQAKGASNGLRRKLSRGIRPSLAHPNRTGASQISIMPTLSQTDPVLETQVFWERHKIKVFAVLILALLAVAAWGGYRIYNERLDATAASSLAAAKTAADFRKVIAQYPGTPAVASAYLFLAEEQRKDKKFTEANATLQLFIDKYPKHELKGTARMGMAGNLESLGKRDEALSMYQGLAADDPQGFSAPAALMAELPLLKAKNQTEEARRVCESVLSKYRESVFANEAQRQLRLLKPPTPPEATPPPPSPPSPATILRGLVPSLFARPPNPPKPSASASAAPTAAAPTAAAPTAAAPTAAAPTAAAPTAAPPPPSSTKRHRRHR
jgi:predicted negative regulator of RcsB-dependent stress response